jgi:CpeT/CpcT family (DUF1001)
MRDTAELQSLIRALAGEFSNQPQAFDQPTWFVQLRLWQRPVPLVLPGFEGYWLFLEQANALKAEAPYRQRLLRLFLDPDFGTIAGQYYQFKDFLQWRQAGTSADRLAQIQASDIEALRGCQVTLRQVGGRYEARLKPGCRCCFDYDGKEREVAVGFDVMAAGEGPVEFWSYDKGIDPQTGKGLWGALMGPYQFQKVVDFGGEVVTRS